MQIREATELDIPCIINLLKISLGEALMPKTEAFWRWKHIDNPFGKSPVLLAFEDQTLVGVRAFMRWEWQHEGQIIKTVRAVDTATHPNHQGKGIFKKLTLKLIESCEQESVQFVFNTPNSKSKPGYLKMGWENLGPMKIYIKPLLRFKLTINNPTHNPVEIDGIKFDVREYRMVTRNSSEFLRWRYIKNPNIKYQALTLNGYEEECSIIYRLKQSKFGTEFRICEQIGNINRELFQKQIMKVAKDSGARFITSSMPIQGLLSVGLKKGPEITVRKLSSFHNSLTFSQWNPSLGDMEVF